MKKYLFNIIIHLCILNGVSAQCTFENFYRYFETDNLNHKVLKLSDGGYLNYGTAVKDTVDFGLTEMDMVLIKTDSCGKVVWINDAGYLADGDPYKYAMETDSGDIIIAGSTAAGLPGSMSNIRLGKYNKDGKLLKEKLIPGSPISAADGIVKYGNNFLVYGSTYNIPTERSYPLIAEVNLSLNIIRQKTFTYSEIIADNNLTAGGINNVTVLESNTIACLIGLGTSNSGASYFVRLDSTFNVTYSNKLNNDTIYFLSISNMILTNNKYLDCSGEFQKEMGSSTKDFLMRMDLLGTIQKTVFLPDSLMTPTSMSPTHDGGYILGPQMVKLDSNFTVQWVKPTRGFLGNVVQLPDGGYAGGGLSDARTKSWGDGFYEMYLVRTDKNGNYIRSGVAENPALQVSPVNIYPNPANTTLNIQSANAFQYIELWSLAGTKLGTYPNTTKSIDISSVAAGLYFLRVINTQNEVTGFHKVCITH